MARMRPVAQRIENPDVATLQSGKSAIGKACDDARIAESAEAKAEYDVLAVALHEGQRLDRTALPFDRHAGVGNQPVFGQDRRILAARGRREAKAEPRMHHPRGVRVAIDAD